MADGALWNSGLYGLEGGLIFLDSFADEDLNNSIDEDLGKAGLGTPVDGSWSSSIVNDVLGMRSLSAKAGIGASLAVEDVG